jgi:hypothetical protein
MTKKERKKYGLLRPPNKAESDTVFLDHGLCGSGGSTYNKDTSQNKLFAFTHNDIPNPDWFEIVEAKNNSATSIQDLFHNIWLAGYPQPQFIVFDNGIVGEFKREIKKISHYRTL